MYRFKLYLYVSSDTSDLIVGINAIREVLERKLKNRYILEIINILDNIEQARREEIFITPTLVRVSPLPVKKIIGDFTTIENALIAMDLVTGED